MNHLEGGAFRVPLFFTMDAGWILRQAQGLAKKTVLLQDIYRTLEYLTPHYGAINAEP